jgi:hypothetical protein
LRSPVGETIVIKGQRIRIRTSSPAAEQWKVPRDAEGTVLCHYRALAGRPGATDKLDVRFGAKTVVWGAPATEFEEISEAPRNRN